MATPLFRSAFPSSHSRALHLCQAALVLGSLAFTPACGGGGGSAAVATVAAPTSLAYPTNPAIYVKGTAIAPNTPTVSGGAVATYSVSPALPAGLSLNATSGQITGTPSTVSAAATYTVRATNAGGSATVSLSLTVNDLAPAFTYSSTTQVYGKNLAIAPLVPTSSGGAVVSWSITPALPSGLVLSSSSGTLSGTPTVGSSAQDYTVTATNSGGSLALVINLAVVQAAPGISTFGASPSTVPMGSVAALNWTLSGDPASALTLDGVNVLGQTGALVTPRRRQQYALTASNLMGATQGFAMVAAQGLERFAGNVSGAGWVDGTGSAARFSQPQGVVVDGAGNLYVSDSANHTIRKVTPAGVVTTFAGRAGESGSTDGQPGGFRNPGGLAIDAAGNLYVADRSNKLIRKITPAGVVSTLAGSLNSSGAATDGTGAAAHFNGPFGLAITAAGDLIVVDSVDQLIRKVSMTGVVTTLAGSAGVSGSADGTGAAARFYYPSGVVAHADGNLYVVDYMNQTIRRVSLAGVVTTVAGSAGQGGSADGTASAARFFLPRWITADGAGDLWVSDANTVLRKVTTAGVVTTVAGGNGSYDWVDGPAVSARFSGPAGLAFLPSGRLAIADEYNYAIRVLDPAQGVSTLAGAPAEVGSTNGPAAVARFRNPASIVVDASGNAFVADYGNSLIRKVTPAGVTSTFAGPAGFSGPSGLAIDAAGTLYVADATNHEILKITSGGTVTSFAGLAATPGSANGTGSAARFNSPSRLALDGAGNLFVSETSNHTIRKITPGGVVTTVAGLAGVTGLVDGNGATARFNMPSGLAVDGSGNLLVGDLNNNRIRRITPAGDVSTLVLSQFIYGPFSLAFNATGTLYVADGWGHAVYTVDTTTGSMTRLLGTPYLPGAFEGAFPAGLSSPLGLAFTPQGDLLVTTANGLMLATAP